MARRYYSFVEVLTQPPTPLKLMQSSTFGDTLGTAWPPMEFGLELVPDEAKHVEAAIAGVRRPLRGVILGSSWPSRVNSLLWRQPHP